jgi:hypothetical protein
MNEVPPNIVVHLSSAACQPRKIERPRSGARR